MTGKGNHERRAHWTVEEAEGLLRDLDGVISARMVVDPRGQVEEIHLVTTRDVPPKKTVRNVESALLAGFDLSVDHRKISVAQTHRRSTNAGTSPPGPITPPATSSPARPAKSPSPSIEQGVIESPWADPAVPGSKGPRLLFLRHRLARSRSRKLQISVELGWQERVFEGNASALDLPRQRLEASAEATLAAVREAVQAGSVRVSLDLDGVELVRALDHEYALVSVHGFVDGRFSPLTGVVSVTGDPEQAVILATLRATERPVRIVLADSMAADPPESEKEEPTSETSDPLRLWGGGS